MKKSNRAVMFAAAVIMAVGLTTIFATKGVKFASVDQSKAATQALQKILKAFPKSVGYHDALSHWGFKLPSGEKFEWTKDTSANKIDLAVILMADQFTNAGVDLKKLDSKLWVIKPSEVEAGVTLPNRLIIAQNISDKKKRTMGYAEAVKNVLEQGKSQVKFDKKHQHYVLSVGNGHEVHWTNKLGSASDFKLVVNPDSLIKAGLDTEKIKASGWKLEKSDSGKNQLVKEFKLK